MTHSDEPDFSDGDFSYIFAIDKLTANGQSFSLSADIKARAQIAARLKIPAVTSLSGEISLNPVRGGVHLKGHLSARIQRVCVATLEPMEEAIDENFAIDFLAHYREEEEPEFDPDAPMIEPLDSDAIDLGEILVQHLALAMAAYPRKTDADALTETYSQTGETSPFAALRNLARRPNGET